SCSRALEIQGVGPWGPESASVRSPVLAYQPEKRTDGMRILMMLWVSVSLLSAQRTVWDGVYTESQADKGSELYDEHCEVCHGDTINARDGGPTLLGAEFRSNWD